MFIWCLNFSFQISGCNKPLRVLYAIDVSDALGDGTDRSKRWLRLRNFLDDINRDVLHGIQTKYVVYNTEPRFLDKLSPCDKATEYFLTGDECLCNKRAIDAGSQVCSVNVPSRAERVEDWGLPGPRTGEALEMARKYYFQDNLAKYKNLVFLISHKTPTDDIAGAESNLKKDGISLIDIELGDRHDLRRRSEISSPYKDIRIRLRERRSSEKEEAIPRDHKMKVSLKKLQVTLRGIVTKVCQSNRRDESLTRSKIHRYMKTWRSVA